VQFLYAKFNKNRDDTDDIDLDDIDLYTDPCETKKKEYSDDFLSEPVTKKTTDSKTNQQPQQQPQYPQYPQFTQYPQYPQCQQYSQYPPGYCGQPQSLRTIPQNYPRMF
jgi:hypothetical protein